MTEQTRIPVPPESEPASLIERAVSTFDLGSFAPPPVPANLAPPVPKPAVRNNSKLAREAVSPARLPATPATPENPAAEARFESASATAGTGPAPAEPLATAEVPVVFSGPFHPVNRTRLKEQGLIVPEGSVTGLLEEFRIIKRQVLLQAADLRGHKVGPKAQRVLICSPHPGEGKTYCATNLALSIAVEKESEVLLVDADFAKPSILSALGLPGGAGLMDALSDPSIDVADCVLGTDIPGLWVLPAGNATNSDSEFLSTSRTATVLDQLTRGAPNRIVIFDSPPALAASPAAELAKFVGQALVVVRADRTGQGSLEDAISLLSACPNIQLLLNAVHFSPSGRRFGSYYGYGG